MGAREIRGDLLETLTMNALDIERKHNKMNLKMQSLELLHLAEPELEIKQSKKMISTKKNQNNHKCEENSKIKQIWMFPS